MMSKNVSVNLIPQYHPAYKASDYPELNRRIRHEEVQPVVKMAIGLGLTHLASDTPDLLQGL